MTNRSGAEDLRHQPPAVARRRGSPIILSLAPHIVVSAAVGALLTAGVAHVSWHAFVRLHSQGRSPSSDSGYFHDESGGFWQWSSCEKWGWRLTVAFDLGRLSGPGRAQPNSTTERLLRENGALEKPPPAEWTLVLQLFTRDSPRNYAEFEVLEVGWPWATSRCISIEYLAHFMHVRPSALEGFRMGEADERPWYSPVSSNFGAGYSIAPTHVLWVPAAMNTGFFGSLVFAVSSIACGPRATSHPESPSVPPLHLVRVLAKGAPLAQCRMP